MNNENNQNNDDLLSMYGVQQPAAPAANPEAAPAEVQAVVDTATEGQAVTDTAAEAPAAEPVITSSSTVSVEMEEAASSTSTDVTDEELLKAFVGDSYENFIHKKFNFGAFFLTSAYAFYRKMILYGFVLCLINMLLSNVKILSYLSIIVNILCGIFANKVYLDFAKKRVAQIKEENRGMTRSQLIDACKQDGGISIGYAIGFPIVIAVVIAILKTALFGA